MPLPAETFCIICAASLVSWIQPDSTASACGLHQETRQWWDENVLHVPHAWLPPKLLHHGAGLGHTGHCATLGQWTRLWRPNVVTYCDRRPGHQGKHFHSQKSTRGKWMDAAKLLDMPPTPARSSQEEQAHHGVFHKAK